MRRNCRHYSKIERRESDTKLNLSLRFPAVPYIYTRDLSVILGLLNSVASAVVVQDSAGPLLDMFMITGFHAVSASVMLAHVNPRGRMKIAQTALGADKKSEVAVAAQFSAEAPAFVLINGRMKMTFSPVTVMCHRSFCEIMYTL